MCSSLLTGVYVLVFEHFFVHGCEMYILYQQTEGDHTPLVSMLLDLENIFLLASGQVMSVIVKGLIKRGMSYFVCLLSSVAYVHQLLDTFVKVWQQFGIKGTS